MRILKKIWNVFSWIVVALTILTAFFLMGVRTFGGLRPFSVQTGSMDPVYSVGTLVYVKKCTLADIKPGDDVTFTINEDLDVATHRVYSVDIKNGSFVTYGVANKKENGEFILDGNRDGRNLVGKVIFSLPYLGYVSDFIMRPPGSYITIILLVTFFVLNIIFDNAEKEKSQSETSD